MKTGVDKPAFLASESQRSDSLGNSAKFASHAQNKTKNSRSSAAIKRFTLQTNSRRLLPMNRVATCLRMLRPGMENVEIFYSPERESAYFGNLRTCDSVWDCPVCAAKITERRRVELMQAISRAHEDGLFPVLVTYTLRHDRGDKLDSLLSALKTAHRKFKSGRAFQTLKQDFGWVGSVTSTEVTCGHRRQKNNGWHPHLHELVFLQPMASEKLNSLEVALKERWGYVLSAEGFDASWERGLTVKDSDSSVIDYVAKWGHEPAGATWTVERELTKAPTKLASDDGATPFQLLEMFGDGDAEAGRLFQEYSAVFHGRAQLVWSRGLRDLLGMNDEKSDSEIMAEADDSPVLLATLSRVTWWELLNLPTDVRGELLVVASAGDPYQLTTYISSLLLPAPPTRT